MAKSYCTEALKTIRCQSDKIKQIYCKSRLIEEKLCAYESELDKFLNDLERPELFVYKCDAKKIIIISCDHCEEKFSNYVQLKKHILKLHQFNLYGLKCSTCNKKFQKRERYFAHMRNTCHEFISCLLEKL